jgi:glycosyltransferase involved in cell wall biosynthesis
LRIGLVVPGFSADATDWCIPALRDFVGQLAPEDDIWVLALRYPASARRYSVFEASIQALGGGVKRRGQAAFLWGAAVAAIAAEHRRRPFDVLHAFWADETGSIAAAAGRVLGVPTVVSIAGGEVVGFHDIKYGGQLSRGGRIKIDLALRLASAVTGGSRYVLDLAGPMLAGRRASRVRHLPLGVDGSRFSPARPMEYRRPDRPPRFVNVSSLVPVKDQQTLLRAASRLKDRGQDFTLDIAGDGPLRAGLQATIDALNLASRVRLVGQIAHDQLPRFFDGATAFVLTSRHEAQCLAVQEAAATGTPVLGTRVGVLPELAMGVGQTVGVGDDRALAGEMARLGSDPSLVATLASSALVRVEQGFRLDRCTGAFRALYRELARLA